MGAIWLIIYTSQNPPVNIEFMKSFVNMQNRGPDDTSYVIKHTTNITKLNEAQVKAKLNRKEIAEYKEYTLMYGFHRLCINDTSKNGAQPFEDPILHKIQEYPELRNRPKRNLMCTGEIYNYEDLKRIEEFTDKDLQSESDAEIILPMYIKYGLDETLKRLNGDFSFVLTENIETYDLKTLQAFIARDVLGIKPLYMIKHKKDTFYMFVSEIKGIPKYILESDNYTLCEVPPGTYWSFQNSIMNKNSEFIRYSDWNYYNSLENCTIASAAPDIIADIYKSINEKLTRAVTERFKLSNVPVGILLSGGFDSAIVLSLLCKYIVETGNNNIIHAFTIGDTCNEDVQSSSEVVNYLESKYGIDIHHHIVSMDSVSTIVELLSEVIVTLETFDPTTIRGAIPYAFLFKYIKENTQVKVLLTGEGLDETCGYKEFAVLGDEEFQRMSVRLVKNLSKYDILRADKMAGRYGLETRHAFVDKEFIEYMLGIHPRLKRPQVYEYGKDPIEKYIVRKAFDNSKAAVGDGLMLPYSILWRRMQDASKCFKNIKSTLREYTDSLYTEQDLTDFVNLNHIRMDTVTKPTTKEEMHYRKVFEMNFGKNSQLVPKFWKQLWLRTEGKK